MQAGATHGHYMLVDKSCTAMLLPALTPLHVQVLFYAGSRPQPACPLCQLVPHLVTMGWLTSLAEQCCYQPGHPCAPKCCFVQTAGHSRHVNFDKWCHTRSRWVGWQVFQHNVATSLDTRTHPSVVLCMQPATAGVFTLQAGATRCHDMLVDKSSLQCCYQP